MSASAPSLFDPSFLDDPYPAYAWLREHDPVHWQELESFTGGMWMFTRYAEAELVLRDGRFLKDGARRNGGASGASGAPMLFRDPPEHGRLRSLVSAAFTPKVAESMRGRIESIVDGLLARMAGSETSDLLSEFALPLPVIVIAELLGVPGEDHERFHGWSSDVILGGDPFLASPERRQRAASADAALWQYLAALVAKRQAEPQEDLVSALIAAEDAGGKLRREEVISTAYLLLIAGHETTVNLIGNGTLALLAHPEQLERLRSEPQLLEAAVEEMLRYDSPVQRSTFRFAGEDVTIAGKTIRQGDQVSAIIGAANRDPAQFAEPDRFDVGREPNRHVAFGRGIHFCLGAPLARLEAQVAFGKLLERFPTLALVEYARRPSTMFRGLERLVVRPQRA